MTRVTVLGDGGWGTALALVLQRNGHAVTVWGPFQQAIDAVRRDGENTTFLPGVALPGDMVWTTDRAEAVQDVDAVVLAAPSQYFRGVAESFAGLVPDGVPVVSVAKGLDAHTGQRMTEVAAELLGDRPIAALSGPSHAEEVARQIPTAVVIASQDAACAEYLQGLFGAPQFRVYTADDVVGVELGGALKNVVAIAVGVSDGLGFGDNTRAALITRGLAEMTRIGLQLGARPATFAGLSGMGDLIVTCTSQHSRNRSVGERLGRGETIGAILDSMQQVAEGVPNSAAARALVKRADTDAPIIEQVYRIIHENAPTEEAVTSLLARDMGVEQR